MPPRHPHLLADEVPPVIFGQCCRRCQRIAFPPDPYGCEQCGAPVEELEVRRLQAAGVVHAIATVHRHHHQSPPVPFTVATIVLDAGPSIKAVLTDPDGAGSKPIDVGDRVEGTTVLEHTSDGADVLDLRFQRAEAS